MTDREKAVVMAYTGLVMLTGNKFDIFHEYVEKIMGRPVFIHEFPTCEKEIKERAKYDFLALCAEEDPERQHGEWRDFSDEGYVECPFCEHATTCDDNIEELHYCFFCGASLSKKEGGTNEDCD